MKKTKGRINKMVNNLNIIKKLGKSQTKNIFDGLNFDLTKKRK